MLYEVITGGGQLACAAALSVVEVLDAESLQASAAEVGAALMAELASIDGVSQVRGRGLMIGFDAAVSAAALRAALIRDHAILTGGGGGPATVRLLPPLTFTRAHAAELAAAIAARNNFV